MQIESIIKRKNGTTVTLGTTTYFFHSPKADDPHVATVDNDDHAQHLLSIKEGFRIYRAKEPAKAVEPEAPAVDQDEPDTREELVEAYRAKFGKKPHPNTSIEKLQTLLSQE